MSVSLGFRPRSEADRLRLCRSLQSAPSRVAVPGDDGWAAVHLAVWGRTPVVAEGVDRVAVDALLTALHLPPLAEGSAEASLAPDGTLKGAARGTGAPLPAVDGPLTSILVCTYNRASMLPAALASARAQTRAREIVVVDDGSTDGTAELLAPLDGVDGIRVIRQENTGKPGALAAALAAARGEYVLVLDDDDLLVPGALHALAAALDAHPEAGAVFGDTVVLEGDGFTAHRPGLRVPPELMPAATLVQVPCQPGACLIRRSAHDLAGPYPPELVRGQDMDLFLRLSRVAPMLGLPVTTFQWRQHDGVRGKAGDQWRRKDREEHARRFQRITAPVFRRRWQELAPHESRREGVAWAAGLALRGLTAEARQEADRWQRPHTRAEGQLLRRAGGNSYLREPKEVLLVVDDGDPGSLEEVLLADSDGKAPRISFCVHREPRNQLEVFWLGEVAAQEIPTRWLAEPVHLRLSSAPGWRPQAARFEPPPLPPQHALRAWAVAVGLPLPERTRPGLRYAEHPVTVTLLQARAHLAAGNAAGALGSLLPVCEALPGWAPVWRLAAETFEAMGMAADAERCRATAAA